MPAPNTQTVELELWYDTDEDHTDDAVTQALDLVCADFPIATEDPVDVERTEEREDGISVEIKVYFEVSSQARNIMVTNVGGQNNQSKQ